MKIGPIGRLLVRWLRPAATSVSPRIEPLPPWPWVEPVAPGTKPPPDPAVDRPWRWSDWVRERDRFGVEGWAYCRFPIRGGEDDAIFVFGSARGSFGIYPAPFVVHETMTAINTDHILPCLVHLPTGTGMGVFGSLSAARIAAESIEKIAKWSGADPSSAAWEPVRVRVHDVLRGIGILGAENAYATAKNDDSGKLWIIYAQSPETLMQGKPEKLS